MTAAADGREPGTRPAAYSAAQKSLHWIMAAVVLFMIPVGLVMVRIPEGPVQGKLFDLHRSFGLVVLALAVVRVAVRTAHGAPADYPGLTRFERLASNAAHHALYVLIFLMPLLGWAGESAFGASWTFFGLFRVPHILPDNRALSDLLLGAHRWAGYLMAAILAAHIGGALMHAVIKRDGVLTRMLPGG